MTTLLRNALMLLGAICILAMASVSLAQITADDVQDTGAPNEAYLDAVRGVQTKVIYLRPEAAFVPGDDVKIDVPKPPEQTQASWETQRWILIGVFAVVLLLVFLMVARFGGKISVSFGAEPKDDSRAGITDAEREVEAVLRQPMDQFLDTLRAMADRREALILLVSRALDRAAEANQVRLGRSQTARDVLRVLPRTWTYMPALRKLVREVEVVHFGGRDLPEDQWLDCLELAAPIIQLPRSA